MKYTNIALRLLVTTLSVALFGWLGVLAFFLNPGLVSPVLGVLPIPTLPVAPPMALSAGGPPPPAPPAPPIAAAAPEPPDDGIRRPSSSVTLTDAQTVKLAGRIKQRISELKDEMGLMSDGTVKPDSFLAIRVRNEQTYDNDLQWRTQIKGSIFAEGHNLTLGTNKAHCRLLAASICDDVLGSKPFFGMFSTPGTADEPKTAALTAVIEEYGQNRIDESNIPNALNDAVWLAIIRNEAVVKTTYDAQKSAYYGPGEVAVGNDGLPIQTPDKGLYIYRKDDFLPDPNVQGQVVLEGDPSFFMPAGVQLNFQSFPELRLEETTYDNVRSEVLEPRDFLCPLDVRDVHLADINVHITEETEEELRAKYGDDVVANTVLSSRSTTGEGQAKTNQGEELWKKGSAVLKKRPMAEVYIRSAAEEGENGEGDPEEHEYIVVYDITADKIYWIDYLYNHMPRRPFDVIPGIEQEPLRWYGVGVFTMMEHSGLFIDTNFNRANKRDGKSGTLRWYQKSAFNETNNGQPLEVGGGKFYTTSSSHDPNKPPVGEHNFASEVSENAMALMEKMEQQANLQFGAISAAGASAVGMNQSRTATGIMNIERNANLLVKTVERLHVNRLEKILDLALELAIENMDDAQVMMTKDALLVTLDREEVRALFKSNRKVKLRLTRSRSAEGVVASKEAEAATLRYLSLTPDKQLYMRQFYVNQLKFYEVDNPDQYLPMVTKEDVAAWQQQQAAQAAQTSQKLLESINFKDLPFEQQQELAQKAGLIPLPPEAAAREKQAAENEAQPPAPPKEPPHGA